MWSRRDSTPGPSELFSLPKFRYKKLHLFFRSDPAGIQTLDLQNFFLSRNSDIKSSIYFLEVIPQGFKPWTFRTGIWRSIQLSYGTLNSNVAAKLSKKNDIHKYLLPYFRLRRQMEGWSKVADYGAVCPWSFRLVLSAEMAPQPARGNLNLRLPSRRHAVTAKCAFSWHFATFLRQKLTPILNAC